MMEELIFWPPFDAGNRSKISSRYALQKKRTKLCTIKFNFVVQNLFRCRISHRQLGKDEIFQRYSQK